MHDIRPFLPELFTPGTMLYIGARKDACSWLTEFHEAGNIIDVLEPWLPNLESLENDERIKSLIYGEARDVPDLFYASRYDKIIWWHGPEHIPFQRIPDVLSDLKSLCRILAVASPDGVYEQGEHEGNLFEIHQSYLYEHNFHNWGFKTKVDPGSEIVAWKINHES